MVYNEISKAKETSVRKQENQQLIGIVHPSNVEIKPAKTFIRGIFFFNLQKVYLALDKIRCGPPFLKQKAFSHLKNLGTAYHFEQRDPLKVRTICDYINVKVSIMVSVSLTFHQNNGKITTTLNSRYF